MPRQRRTEETAARDRPQPGSGTRRRAAERSSPADAAQRRLGNQGVQQLARQEQLLAQNTARDEGDVAARQREETGEETDEQGSDSGARYVYLASGEGLTSGGMDSIERWMQREFVRYGIEFDDDWLVRTTEDGTKALLLRWQSSWGEPPSLWMEPARVPAFLHEHFAEGAYTLAEDEEDVGPYRSEDVEETFSDEERRWIQEVMEMELVSLLLRVYRPDGGMPPVVLHRITEFERHTVAGQHDDGQVAIAEERTLLDDDDNRINTESEFKRVLVHELLHFVEDQTADLADEVVVPRLLKAVLLYPEKFGFPEYAFGWFEVSVSEIEPGRGSDTDSDSGSTGYVRGHISDTPYPFLPPDVKQLGRTKSEMQEKLGYEDSPDTRNPEEDLADTLALYVLEPGTLREEYPRRFRLMQWYFDRIQQIERRRIREETQ